MIKLKRLLIIPARGGSKRIKNKNIKKFNNKPIIFYSIESAKKSKLFNKIHVSTDSRKISNVVKKKGIEVDFLRPKKISDDKTALHDVYKFVVQKYEKLGFSFNEIWTLMPCAPNINYKDLISASKFFAYVRACFIIFVFFIVLLASVNKIAPASINNPISVNCFPSIFFVIEAAGKIFTPLVSLALFLINSIIGI